MRRCDDHLNLPFATTRLIASRRAAANSGLSSRISTGLGFRACALCAAVAARLRIFAAPGFCLIVCSQQCGRRRVQRASVFDPLGVPGDDPKAFGPIGRLPEAGFLLLERPTRRRVGAQVGAMQRVRQRTRLRGPPVTPLYAWRRCYDQQSAHRIRQGLNELEGATRARHRARPKRGTLGTPNSPDFQGIDPYQSSK
jgi:hypothetical protein